MQHGQQTVWKYSYWLDDGHLAQLGGKGSAPIKIETSEKNVLKVLL